MHQDQTIWFQWFEITHTYKGQFSTDKHFYKHAIYFDDIY